MTPLTTIGQIVEEARCRGPVPCAVAAPYDEATLSAVKEGVEQGLIRANLFGEGKRLREKLSEVGIGNKTVTVTDCASPISAAIAAVRAGDCHLLMKGAVTTPALLKAVLDKQCGLNTGRVCSHLAVCQLPGWDRLLMISDGGLNILPTVEQKADIIRNMAELGHSLGIEEPKIAVLASLEEVRTNIPATVDAAILTQMQRRGQIKGCVVDGPLAIDNIVSAEAAKKKGIVSPVAGQADGIVVPSVECGNVLGKGLSCFLGINNAAVVLGAAAPIVLPSRSGRPESKWASIALGVLMATK